MHNNVFPNTGLFNSLGGIKVSDDKKNYYFQLLKNIFDGKYSMEHLKQCNCGSTDLEVLSVHDRFCLPFGTLICKTCGLIQLSPRLSEIDLPGFYRDIYWGLIIGKSEKLSTGDGDMGRMIFDLTVKYLCDSFKNRTLSIIEIGCGSGVKIIELKKSFEQSGIRCNVTGCDYSENAVTLAKKKNIEVLNGGVESLVGRKADLVVLSHVVEHFFDIRKEFDKIKLLLNKGAYVYIEVPGVCDLKNKGEYNYNYLLYSVMAHIYNFNLTSLRSVIEPLGFKYIYGDEYVRSIFKYDPQHGSNVDVSGNYVNTMTYLRELEVIRTDIEARNSTQITSKIKSIIKKQLMKE